MEPSLTETAKIRKALWRIVDADETPKTVALQAIEMLIDLQKQETTQPMGPSPALAAHRKRAKGEVV